MQVIKDIDQWQALRRQIAGHLSIGFVPTMGNLHVGHASLIRQSCLDNEITVVSVFVNDKQFNDCNDFFNYPITTEDDLTMLRQLGVDYCFMPTSSTMYPDDYQFQLTSSAQAGVCEDAHRPGHFTGVLTVVMKLLQLIQPHKAYFGEKDYQQWQLIKGMVAAFFMPVDILALPTLRENDGLPFSSRNQRLSANGRQKAAQFANIFSQNKSLINLRAEFDRADIIVAYLQTIGDRRLVAVHIDDVRLIDNRLC